MKITKQQVKELKHLINNETCNSSEVKDKIKEILPQLLNPFEVGKYYTFQNEEEGKFAQVNKKSLIFEDNLTLGNAEVWEKTMDLRWQWDMVFDSQNTSKLARVLQQKWVENNTGTAKWENI
jgi:hypothetical protein